MKALPPIPEKQFLGQVREAAYRLGWLDYHPLRSEGSTPGFPDLTLVRGVWLHFAELKRSAKEKPTPAQQQWLDRLERVERVGVHIWRPGDWPQIERVLQ
jgi:hypothetical protein